MGLDIVLGLQWGDEGKGKIVDVLTPQYDIVARFQGGPNAGHTLNIKGEEIVLHTIPSGIIHKNVMNVIGAGMVIDPATLKDEVDKLKKDNLFDKNQLYIAKNAHIILPTHRKLDEAKEANFGETKIGSTLKGIGPCYTDKAARKGLRIRDIFSDNFDSDFQKLEKDHLTRLAYYNASDVSREEEKNWWEGIKLLKDLNTINAEEYLNNQLEKGDTILAEGAQGTFLDLDFGTYPYVTSSNTTSANACLGLGVAPTKVNKVFGVVKAYTTRVGEGPFPTELLGNEGNTLREKGNEYGATTGRPRRCGWLDLTGLKYAIKLNGVTDLIITKSDVLQGLDEIKISDGFSEGLLKEEYPEIINGLNNFTPIYKNFSSWKQKIGNISNSTELPEELINYLDFIRQETNSRITLLSTGPKRDEYLEL